MKTFLAVLIVVAALLTSCEQMQAEMWNAVYTDELSGHVAYYSPEFDNLHNYVEIAEWINVRVKYDSEDNKDKISDPKTTLNRGKGSCADIAILFINIVHFSLHEDLGVAYIDSSTQKLASTERSIVGGGDIDHVIPFNGNVCISQYNGKIYTANIEFEYDYDEIFERRP